MLISIRNATQADVDRIVENVRWVDWLDWVAAGYSPYSQLRHYIDSAAEPPGAPAGAAVVKGEPMLLWGIDGKLGSCWMMAHRDAPTMSVALYKAILPELKSLQSAHGALRAEVWCKNELRLAWLGCLGFKGVSIPELSHIVRT